VSLFPHNRTTGASPVVSVSLPSDEAVHVVRAVLPVTAEVDLDHVRTRARRYDVTHYFRFSLATGRRRRRLKTALQLC